MARWPLTLAPNSLGGLVPRNLVRVSDICPVVRSTCVRSSTPLLSPARRSQAVKVEHWQGSRQFSGCALRGNDLLTGVIQADPGWLELLQGEQGRVVPGGPQLVHNRL